MIILFKDFGTDYWIKNKIVDCGLSDNNQLLHTNLELPNDELQDYELQDYELPDDELPDDELIFLDKLNVKPKNNNEPGSKKKYIGINTEIIGKNSSKKDPRYKFGGNANKYKPSNFRINDIQETSTHICIHTGIYSNNYKRKV